MTIASLPKLSEVDLTEGHFAVEPPFDQDYTRGIITTNVRDRRKYVTLYPKTGGQRFGTTLSRYKMCVLRNELLPRTAQVEHIDGNPNNYANNNLRLTTRQEAGQKRSERYRKYNPNLQTLTCDNPECGKTFTLTDYQVRDRQNRGHQKFYCSPACSAAGSRKVGDDIIQQVTQLKSKGLGVVDIAAKLNISRHAVNEILRKQQAAADVFHIEIDKPLFCELIKQRLEGGTLPDIAQRLNKSLGSMRRYWSSAKLHLDAAIKLFGEGTTPEAISNNTGVPAALYHKYWLQTIGQHIPKILRLLGEGYTLKEIADILKLPIPTVKDCCALIMTRLANKENAA